MRWDTVILDAIGTNDEEEIDMKKLTKALKRADMAEPDWLNENKALLKACMNNNYKVAQILLMVEGIDVNQSDDDWTRLSSPLFMACLLRHLEVVHLLLAVPGIQVNQANGQGETPLLVASQQGFLGCVHLLLRAKGIQINQATNKGATPLFAACQHGHLSIVNALLNFDPRDDDKYDAESLRQRQTVDINKGPGKLTPLDVAIGNKHWDIVVRLEDIPSVKKPSYKRDEGYIRARNKANVLQMLRKKVTERHRTKPGGGDLATILGRQGHFLPKPVETSGTYMQFVKKESLKL